MPPPIPPRKDLLERIDRCLGQFSAKRVDKIEDAYAFVPDQARARMGSGSYGETYRMMKIDAPKEPARIVKFINKARIATNDLQVQHLCVELAVLGFINHRNINHRTDLLHTESTIYIVLELCEGQTPSLDTRLYHLFARHIPSRIAEVPAIITSFKSECEGLSADEISVKEDDLVRRVCIDLNKKEIPVSSDLFNCIVANIRIHPLKAAIIIKAVLQGLKHLHEKLIVHRDMKTENIVLGETRNATPLKDAEGNVIGVRISEKLDVKVIDFGLVKYMNMSSFPTTPSPGCFGSDDPFARATSDVFDNTPSSAGSHLIHQTPGFVDCTPCGTEIYCALEVLDGIVGSGFGRRKWQTTKDQLPKFDVYGAGTALYCMINGRPPFRVAPNRRCATREERLAEIQQQVTYGPPYWTTVCPPEMKEFILSLMNNDLKTRPTANEALRNPLVSSVGDTFTYEVLLDGTIQNVTAAPTTFSSSSARSAPIVTTATVKKDDSDAVASAADARQDSISSVAAANTEGSATSEDLSTDAEQERKEIDDIMTLLRGKEDDGDDAGKKSVFE